MANISIPNLPPVIALSGAEQFEVVQGGVSKRATLNQVASEQGGIFVTYSNLASTTSGLGAGLVGTTLGITDEAVNDGLVMAAPWIGAMGDGHRSRQHVSRQ